MNHACRLSACLCAGASMFAATQAMGQRANTFPGRTLSVPWGSKTVAIADMNNDQAMDVVVVNRFGEMSVYRGDHNDSFLPRLPQVGTGVGSRGLIVKDINGDAAPDVIGVDSSITVSLGLGDGNVGAPILYNAGVATWCAALADINGDGSLDLVAAGDRNSTNNSSVVIFWGQGNGSFLPGPLIEAGASMRSLAVADFNGDSNLDLVLSDYTGGGVYVLYGDGAGGFPSREVVNPGSQPTSVAAADVNADGAIDFVVTNELLGTVTVYLASEGGSFAAQPAIQVGNVPVFIIAEDLDADGDIDLAVLCKTQSSVGFVTTLLGNGAGAFVSGQRVHAGALPTSLAYGDLNSDGFGDFVVVNPGIVPFADASIGSVSLHYGSGNGAFKDLHAPSVSRLVNGAMVVGNVNADSVPDIITAVPGVAGRFLETRLGIGGGVFGSPIPITGNGSRALRVHDMTGDGVPDLLALGSSLVSLFRGLGAGAFEAVVTIPSWTNNQARSIAIADFNRDGIPDFATPHVHANGRVLVNLGLGGGAFAPQVFYPTVTLPIAVEAADFNADGITDLAALSPTNATVSIHLGVGDGTFLQNQVFPAGALPQAMAVGDLNHDLISDCVISSSTNRSVSIMLGLGGGALSAPVTTTIGHGPASVATGDFDGDGHLDIVVANTLYTNVSILFGNGDGTFGAEHSYNVGGVPELVSVADANGDGRLDLIVGNTLGRIVAILPNQTPPPFCLGDADGNRLVNFDDITTVLSHWAAACSPPCPGDANADGAVDLADITAILSLWLNTCP